MKGSLVVARYSSATFQLFGSIKSMALFSPEVKKTLQGAEAASRRQTPGANHLYQMWNATAAQCEQSSVGEDHFAP